MSRDYRDFISSRSDDTRLPPLREIVGDALDGSSVSPYSFDFHDVNHALPGSSKSYGSHPNYGGYYPTQRGPKLPPILNYHPSHSHSEYRNSGPASADAVHSDQMRSPSKSSTSYHDSSTTKSQSSTGPLPYSYNVLRTQQGDLVDVRTPSSRAQGILRPTAIIDDEDDSHKRYKCTWLGCDKKYDRPSSLEVHRHTHTGQQPYPCSYPGCPRAFNVKSNMLRHFRSHAKVQVSQTSSAKEEPDSDSDGDDDKDKFPKESMEKYFHRGVSPANRPLSSSSFAKPSVSKKIGESPSSSSTRYYNSSRPR